MNWTLLGSLVLCSLTGFATGWICRRERDAEAYRRIDRYLIRAKALAADAKRRYLDDHNPLPQLDAIIGLGTDFVQVRDTNA